MDPRDERRRSDMRQGTRYGGRLTTIRTCFQGAPALTSGNAETTIRARANAMQPSMPVPVRPSLQAVGRSSTGTGESAWPGGRERKIERGRRGWALAPGKLNWWAVVGPEDGRGPRSDATLCRGWVEASEGEVVRSRGAGTADHSAVTGEPGRCWRLEIGRGQRGKLTGALFVLVLLIGGFESLSPARLDGHDPRG